MTCSIGNIDSLELLLIKRDLQNVVG